MSKPVFGQPLPIEVIVVVEGGICREIYSLDIPLKYTILDFDNDTEEEFDPILEYTQQNAVVEHDSLEMVITRLKEEYS